MLSFILAESSLELVPKELLDHPSVVSHSKKLGKVPEKILLDNSWHFAAMKGIKNEIKRGRPDIVHLSLLEICGTPLYFEQKIQVYVHTLDDKVIFIGNKVRLPKSYHRFVGLIEQLYVDKVIQENGTNLLELKDLSLSELLTIIQPNQIIGLSTEGISSSFEEISNKLTKNSCIVIGGFQKGHFSEKIKNKFDELFSVGKSLETHVVISRILYEYEKTIFK